MLADLDRGLSQISLVDTIAPMHRHFGRPEFDRSPSNL